MPPADAGRRRAAHGRLWVAGLAALLLLPLLPWMLATPSTTLALVLNAPVSMAGSMWIGVGAATVQDLVLPRMRATASVAYLVVVTVLGLVVGPYRIGSLSDGLGSLRHAMLLGLVANVAAALLLLSGARRIGEDERTLRARAEAAGERPAA